MHLLTNDVFQDICVCGWPVMKCKNNSFLNEECFKISVMAECMEMCDLYVMEQIDRLF